MVADMPGMLVAYHLQARALYYDHHSQFANASGPHLIHCPDTSVIATVRGAFPSDGVVWWVWAEADEDLAKDAIFRHLRRLGMVEIPEGYPKPPRPRAPMERVLFRHADARVMARVLPVLDPAQRARLFGKAGAIVLEIGGKLRRALVPAGLPLAPPGLLRLTAAQMDAISEAGKAQSHTRIAAYLRRNLPPQLEHLTDDELLVIADHSDGVGRNLGLKSEKAHARWAYLMMLTGGQIAVIPEVKAAFNQADDPDTCVKDLVAESAAALRKQATA